VDHISSTDGTVSSKRHELNRRGIIKAISVEKIETDQLQTHSELQVGVSVDLAYFDGKKVLWSTTLIKGFLDGTNKKLVKFMDQPFNERNHLVVNCNGFTDMTTGQKIRVKVTVI